MNKYIPKVGEEFEWKFNEIIKWSKARKVICITKNEIGYESDTGYIVTISKQCMFRPIPTKADVEREQLLEILCHSWQDTNKKLDRIQQAGFTIPKKVKRSELKKIINHHHGDSAVSYTKTVDILICNLLGDLVEQDEGGDV
jgi:hypothetical protein